MRRLQELGGVQLEAVKTAVHVLCRLQSKQGGKTMNKKIAEALYNAGYRKTFTSDFASDTQKAYKEGYDKGFLDGREEFDIILQRNKQLKQAREISKSDIERLKTQLQQANV